MPSKKKSELLWKQPVLIINDKGSKVKSFLIIAGLLGLKSGKDDGKIRGLKPLFSTIDEFQIDKVEEFMRSPEGVRAFLTLQKLNKKKKKSKKKEKKIVGMKPLSFYIDEYDRQLWSNLDKKEPIGHIVECKVTDDGVEVLAKIDKKDKENEPK